MKPTKFEIEAAKVTLDKYVPGWSVNGTAINTVTQDGVTVQISFSVKSVNHAIVEAAKFINWNITENGSLDL
jgi:hypothetical protein